MITVSDSFKKAIKSENREIYGYVDVEYEKKDFELSISQLPTGSNLVPSDGIISGNKLLQKYASLENNYTLLDGSFMVWNENTVAPSGYISNQTFENITNPTILITNNSTSLSTKGVTIYFKENLPLEFTVVFTTTDNEEIVDNVFNNNKYVYQYLFNTEVLLASVQIDINRVEFSQNRLRIANIDFNLSDFYEGEELISFEVTEELDLLLENLPINTCTINLNNYPNAHGSSKFDILNPQGITNYLNENTKIKPYIGILTESNGIEYVPMGVFYLTNWSSDTNGNATFNGEHILNKFKNKQMIVDTDFMFNSLNIGDIGDMLKEQMDVDVNFPTTSYPWTNDDLKNPDLFEYLLHVIPYFLYYDSPYDTLNSEYRKFYTDRYGVITLNKINTTVIDTINQNLLKQDVDCNLSKFIKYLTINSTQYSTSNNGNIDIINENHTLNNNEEYVWFSINNKYVSRVNSFTYNVVSGNGTATMIGYNRFMVLVKFTGEIGSVLSIVCNALAGDVSSTEKNTTAINDISDGDTITINLSDYRYIIDGVNEFKKIYFNLPKKFKIKAETMGDPSLEIGDTIKIQTRYRDVNNGYKNIIITKQKFTFDGGLSCELEGQGN